MMLRPLAILGALGCSLPARQAPPQPAWKLHAEQNRALGDAAYAAKLRAAPRRAPGEPITVAVSFDDPFFSYRRLFDAELANRAAGTVTLTLGRQSSWRASLQLDWYQAMAQAEHQPHVDVYAVVDRLEIRQDAEARAACPGLADPIEHAIVVRWSSAYVRADHTAATRVCLERSELRDAATGRMPQAIAELVDELVAHVDLTVRLELPALSAVLALTPPHRYRWYAGPGRSSSSFGDDDD